MDMTRRRPLLIGLLVLLLAAAGVSAAVLVPNAQELLTRAVARMDSIEDAYAIVEAEAVLPEETISGTAEVWWRRAADPEGHDAFKVIVLDASQDDLVGMTAVSDGEQGWLYDPGRNKVMVGTAEEMKEMLAERMAESDHDWSGEHDGEGPEDYPETPAEKVEKLLEYFTANREGNEEVADVAAQKVRLVPIAEQMSEEMRAAGGYFDLWLRADDQLPLAVEYAKGTMGSGYAQARDVAIDTGLGDDVFTFVVPEGVEVVKATEAIAEHTVELPEDFVALKPAELPDGVVALAEGERGGWYVQRFEMPGGGSFTLAQGLDTPPDPPVDSIQESVTVRGQDGVLYSNEAGERTLLMWGEGDKILFIGGDLSPEEALAVAESLE